MYVMQREKDEEKSKLSMQSKVSWSHLYTDVVQHDRVFLSNQ